MSLRSRRFFDALQHHPSSLLRASRFRLPCPPYHTPEYWERIYKDMESDDVHEWGGFDLQNGLMQFQYEPVLHVDPNAKEPQEGTVHTTSFAELMGVSQLSTPEEAIERYEELQSNDQNETVLLLGCGTSKVGEQLLKNSFVGPVLQIDISSKVIQLMTKRYQRYLDGASVKRMELIVDDARGLTALSPDSVGGGILDKGLVDNLHQSTGEITEGGGSGDNPIRQIVDSAHRVLQPSRPFVFFSRSDPEYILRRAFGTAQWESEIMAGGRGWKEIEVRKLVDWDLLLYRFVKADEGRASSKKRKRRNQ